MGESIHVFEEDSVLLVLRTAPNERRPFSCKVTAPDGKVHTASPGVVPGALVPVRSTDFSLRFPGDFADAPSLVPGGRYHVAWQSAGPRMLLLGEHEFEIPLTLEGEWVPHQLTIGLEYEIEGALEVLWRYPYSRLHLIEQQVVRMEGKKIPADEQGALEPWQRACVDGSASVPIVSHIARSLPR